MDQNTNTGVPVTPVVENKQKGRNGLKIATAIACVVAVCGIGFGVYGMIQSSQKDSQISDLKVQIKEADRTVTTIEAPEIETTTNDGTTATIKDSVIKDENTEDYIYIGEWRTKIRKPKASIVDGVTQDKSIAGISYASDGYRLYIWATVYRNGDQAAGDGVMYAGNGKIVPPSLIEIDTSYTDDCLHGEKIGKLNNGKTLCYIETDDGTLVNAFGDYAMNRYIKPTIEILKESFTNIDNYSVF